MIFWVLKGPTRSQLHRLALLQIRLYHRDIDIGWTAELLSPSSGLAYVSDYLTKIIDPANRALIFAHWIPRAFCDCLDS